MDSAEAFVPARIEPREIGFVNALIEGHEGICLMRTVDRRRGIVCFWVPEGQREAFEGLIDGLRREVSLAPIPEGDPILDGLELLEWRLGDGAQAPPGEG